MMTSINPKNVNLNNMAQNKVDILPNQVNNLYQRNNYIMDKGDIRSNEGINNNMNYNQNLNINQIPQTNVYKNLNPEINNMNLSLIHI